jgi:hypothetical protein
LARNCRNAGSYGNRSGYRRGGGGGGGYKVICYNCGGFNHFAKDCKASGVKCYNCGRFGHIVSFSYFYTIHLRVITYFLLKIVVS